MKYINVIDAKEQFSYLVNLLCDPQEEVYLTLGGKPIIKMTPITENLPRVEEKNPALNPEHKSEHKPDPRRVFGIAKGTFTFDDELFDALDAEIWREVADSYEVKR
ncbi:MAG: hypothetical protein IJG80_06525 [Selenomonadaceae bacterium]|nr:hypothetical protein [Selenomonadaceae bacterium]MBQ3727719.1 hypothetical protein [Selenomonadaceae bacterium]